MGGRGKDYGGNSGNGSGGSGSGSAEGDAEWWLEGKDPSDFGYHGLSPGGPGGPDDQSPDAPGGGPGDGPGSGPEQDMVDAWAEWQEARQKNDAEGMDQAQRKLEDALIRRDADGAQGLERSRLLANLRGHQLGTWLRSSEGRNAIGTGVGVGVGAVAVGGLTLGGAATGGGGGGSSPSSEQPSLFDPEEE